MFSVDLLDGIEVFVIGSEEGTLRDALHRVRHVLIDYGHRIEPFRQFCLYAVCPLHEAKVLGGITWIVGTVVLGVVELHDDALSFRIVVRQLLDSWRLEGASLNLVVAIVPAEVSRSVDRRKDRLFSYDWPYLFVFVADCA